MSMQELIINLPKILAWEESAIIWSCCHVKLVHAVQWILDVHSTVRCCGVHCRELTHVRVCLCMSVCLELFLPRIIKEGSTHHFPSTLFFSQIVDCSELIYTWLSDVALWIHHYYDYIIAVDAWVTWVCYQMYGSSFVLCHCKLMGLAEVGKR